MVKTLKRRLKLCQFQNKLFFCFIFYDSILQKIDCFYSKTINGKKAVLENPKNFKKKKKRSKEEIDVEEKEVKERERGRENEIMCEIES